eukprot:scaffold516_cov307-Pavlova_lutheri.AAC.3
MVSSGSGHTAPSHLPFCFDVLFPPPPFSFEIGAIGSPSTSCNRSTYSSPGLAWFPCTQVHRSLSTGARCLRTDLSRSPFSTSRRDTVPSSCPTAMAFPLGFQQMSTAPVSKVLDQSFCQLSRCRASCPSSVSTASRSMAGDHTVRSTPFHVFFSTSTEKERPSSSVSSTAIVHSMPTVVDLPLEGIHRDRTHPTGQRDRRRDGEGRESRERGRERSSIGREGREGEREGEGERDRGRGRGIQPKQRSTSAVEGTKATMLNDSWEESKRRKKRVKGYKAWAARLLLLTLVGLVGFSLYLTHAPLPRAANHGPHGRSKTGIYAMKVQTLGGAPADLGQYAGLVALVTNVASECGYTDSNYKGLQKLYEKYRNRGFVVLGFPCNQFGAQEPGSPEEIQAFVRDQYGVTFPLFQKVDVRGQQHSPVFEYLTKELGGEPEMITWNFHKFLVDRNGKPVKHYNQKFSEEELEKDISRLLKKP